MRSTTARRTWRQVANLGGYLATLVVNAMANALPLGGKTTGELSAEYPNLFVPAGFTFAVWGPIYLLLGVFAVYQARDLLRSRKVEMRFLPRVGWLFVLASAANVGWLFAWHYGVVWLSLLVMVGLLASLIGIYVRLGIGIRSVPLWDRICVHHPFSVYLGWITVATIANAAALLVGIGWDGWGLSDIWWTVIMLLLGAALALTALLRRRDVLYAAVVIWAYFGILVKRLTVDSPAVTELAVTAALCLGAMAAVTVLRAPAWLALHTEFRSPAEKTHRRV